MVDTLTVFFGAGSQILVALFTVLVLSLSIAAIVSKILDVVVRWQPKDPTVVISFDDWKELRAEPPELQANPEQDN
jgi:hypothetical protein